MSDDVSRETSAPPAVAAVFGDHLATAREYHDLLAGPGVERGLIGPREVPRLWERHLLNSGVAAAAVEHGSTVIDVGTGAGLPGLVWSIARPDLGVTLLEPLARRVAFLEEAVAALGLGDRVRVVRGRAEETTTPRNFDVVTSRAVAPLEKLLRWSIPLARPGGVVLALKGERATAEVADLGAGIHRLGGASIAVEEYGADLLDIPTRVVRVLVADRRPRSRPKPAG